MEGPPTVLDELGYLLLPSPFAAEEVREFIGHLEPSLARADSESARLESRGVTYAARNVLECCPPAVVFWRRPVLVSLLREVLGAECGLVRGLYFDKPPERSWSLPWHKDRTIAVRDNRLASTQFTRPTRKAGVPHVEAPEAVLRRMLTLRIHLDPVTEANGPLQVIPGSHHDDETAPPVAILAEAGDVLAMRPLLSHASGQSHAGTTLHRRILHLEFAADRRLPDGFQWHTWIDV